MTYVVITMLFFLIITLRLKCWWASETQLQWENCRLAYNDGVQTGYKLLTRDTNSSKWKV